MFSKKNLKYIFLTGIGFFWCSSLYLTQEQYLLNYMSALSVNIVDMLFASLSMAIGIILFMYLYRHNKNIKAIYIIFLIISIAFSIIYFMVPLNIVMSIMLCLICLLGTAGYGGAYHFSLIVSNIESKYRARVFALGYTIGTIFTFLVSLLPQSIFISKLSLFIYIPIILMNIHMILELDIKEIKPSALSISIKKNIVILGILVFLMAIVTSFSSNLFSLTNINRSTGFAYPRLYCSIGLIIAGVLADEKAEYIEVATLISLFFPLLVMFLLKENTSIIALSCLNYVFLAFFVVFRTTVFMNLSDKNHDLLYLAGLGLCISRIVEGLLVLINYYYNFGYLFLIVSIVILLSIILVLYILFYKKRFHPTSEDIIGKISVKYKLSSQESKVMELLLQDYTNQEIADKLFLSINTVRNHIANIYKKTQMKKKDLKEIYILKCI